MLNMRFEGTDTALMVLCEEGENENFDMAFKRSYKHEFGFLLETNILVDDIKVGCTAVLIPFDSRALIVVFDHDPAGPWHRKDL